MKIAQVVSTFPPYEAGIGNVCYNVSKKLGEFGHDVEVFVPLKNDNILDDSNLPFKINYVKPIFTIGNASLFPSLNYILKKFDIIHLHYPFFGGDFLVKNAAKKNNIPFVLTYHQDVYGDTLFKIIIFKLYNFVFQKMIFKNATKIIGLSKDHIHNSQVKNLVSLDTNLSICPNGINLSDFEDKSTILNIRKDLNINDHHKIIVFVGALDKPHYFKGLDMLLEVMKEISHKAHLVVIGDGDQKEKYICLAKNYNIEKNVSFIGRLPNTEVVTYLKQTDFLVLPSIDTESFGLVLIEAMACSKPVIASNLHGVRAVVQNGVNGLLFKKGDVIDLVKKVNYLLDNKDVAKKYGKNGREIVEDLYTWDKVVRKHEEIYLQCLNRQ